MFIFFLFLVMIFVVFLEGFLFLTFLLLNWSTCAGGYHSSFRTSLFPRPVAKHCSRLKFLDHWSLWITLDSSLLKSDPLSTITILSFFFWLVSSLLIIFLLVMSITFVAGFLLGFLLLISGLRAKTLNLNTSLVKMKNLITRQVFLISLSIST